MYITQFHSFYPNKSYPSPTRDRTRASSAPSMLPYQLHHAALSTTPIGPPLPLTPRRRGHMYITQFLFLYPNNNLHLPHQGSNPCFLLSHHAYLLTTPIGPPHPLTPRGRGHRYITQFLCFNPNINLHFPHQGSNLCLRVAESQAGVLPVTGRPERPGLPGRIN